MTSSRGQNVSILPRSDTDSTTIFTNDGGNLRSTSRKISPRAEKTTVRNEKSFGRHFSKNFSTDAFAAFQNRECSSTNKCPTALVSNNVNSSSLLNSVNRELSPVRWCDRYVDGVYLGKSGWVQVQQRFLDNCKDIHYNENISFSALSSRKNFSELNPDCRFKERKESLNLPLHTKKRIIQNNYERSSKFIQEFESVSPPLITPIISPPPAFKDDGLDAEFSKRSIREPYFCIKSFPRRSESTADAEIFSTSLLERGNDLNSSSILKHQHPINQTLQIKSFEDDHLHKIRPSSRTDPTAHFRSLDNKEKMTNEQKLSVKNSFHGSFKNPRKINVKEKEKESIGNEEIANNKHFLRLQSSSWETLNEQKFLSKEFPRLNYEGGRRRNIAEEFWNSYRTRSSSLDSNSKSSNSSISSSGSSSRSNINYKNVEKTISQKFDSQQSQSSKFENFFTIRDRQYFNVKRSRSLQLSEKKSPNESFLLNNSFSENSWTPDLLECSTFPIKNQNKEPFRQHFLNHVFVTVNGESVPVVASSKITKSAVEQKKLIMEAEREARIISEFMNGNRSRSAARNLLMHRYFNQLEDENSTVLMERNNSQKTEHESRFLTTKQSPSNKRNCLNKTYFDGRSFCKKNQLNSPTTDFGEYLVASYSKPLTFAFSNSNQASYQSGSYTSFHNYLNQRKVEQVENKEKEKSHLVYLEQTNSNLSERKRQNRNIPFDRAYLNSRAQKERVAFFLSQKLKLNSFKGHNSEKPKSELMDMNLKNMSKSATQIFSVKTISENEKRNFNNNTFNENSLLSPSASGDICMNDFGAKFKKNKKITGSSLFNDYILDTNSKTIQECFRFRPGSAPESESYISKGIDMRSFSLPRSFLSERYRSNDSHQRNLLPLKQGHSKIPTELSEENRLNLQSSRTAPTTPVPDLRFGKSTENLYQIPSYRSSCASLFGETSLFNPRRIIQENASKKSERSVESSNEMNIFCVDEKLLKIPDSSSETILQKLKKNFSLKYLKKKEHLKDSIESINHKTKGETLPVAESLIFSLQAFENSNSDISEQACGFVRKKSFEKRIFKNEKHGSRDSGIQILNRGIIDSSESQDTDIQEDTESPLVVRRYEIRPKNNFRKLKSEVKHILTDKFQVDFQKRIRIKKHTIEKVIKRSNSDLEDHKLLNWNVKKYGERLSLFSSPLRSSNAKTNPEVSVALNRFERLLKLRLIRSLSLPVGLNDLPSFERRRPSTLKEFALRGGQNSRNSEGEFLSDSESSVSSLGDRKKSFDFAPREVTIAAEAVWDHVAIESGELTFRAGDMIEVLDTRDSDWWWGATKKNTGYFPSAFVRLRVNQEETIEDCLTAVTKGKSFDQVRSRIIIELLNTEREFVKILQDVKDGYVNQCKQRTDMFTSTQVTAIFSNLEDLLAFQNKFLDDLETNINKEFPFKSCIGEVFLNHGSSFQIYSEYCNSHPMAISTLQDLYQKYSYCQFFEMCRLKQSLIEIPLDGYLLTPVQRICKYPLQLGELLKYTKPDHPDYKNVQKALETMRSVATLINERKRKMESLEKLASWQQNVEGWEGEDLIEISSQLIHQGDVVKITSGIWTSNITLFLFDHQIIYCKKDLLKKNGYIYKGRISLDESDVIDIPDGKCQKLGMSIKCGLRINNNLKDKWLVFCCRSNEDKIKWLEVLAEEKKLVAQDKERNLDLPSTAKQLVKMAIRTNKCPPCKLKGKNKFAFSRDALFCTESRSDVSKSEWNKKTGIWLPFGGMIKNTKAGWKPRASLYRFT